MQFITDLSASVSKSSKQDLTLWRDPKASGVVFAAGLLAFYFLVFLEYDFLTLALRLFQLFMVGALVASFLKVQVPAKDKETLENLLSSHSTAITSVIVAKGSEALLFINKVVRWEDKPLSAQAFFGSIVASWLLNMFSVTSLAFLAWIVAFSVPMFFDKFSDAPWMVNAKKAVEVNVKKVPALSKALGYDEKKTE